MESGTPRTNPRQRLAARSESTLADPDRALVLRAQRELPAESASYRALVERHRGALLARASRILGSRADADEAVQEAFISVFRALPSYRAERPFSHWLSVILLNACRMILRQRAQEQRRRDGLRLEGESRLPESGPVGDPILSAVISDLLGALPPSTRAAIWMRTIEHRPHSEIAKKLRMTESAVKMRISRGTLTMRARYLERLDAEPLSQSA